MSDPSAAEQVDAVVLGMGVGGESVAGQLAEAGLNVVGVDAVLLGGECPYWGCVPSKMMVRAANLLAESARVSGLAGTASATADWSPVARRIREEATDDWDDTVAVERFEGKGGRFVRGTGRILGPGRVGVEDRVFTVSRAIVVATGTSPAAPPIPGLAETPYWTNREAVEVKELPRSLVVLGGGAIGVELTQVFARFGVAVTLVEAVDRLMAADEPEAGRIVADVLRRDGVQVLTGVSASRVRHGAGGFTLDLGEGATASGEQLLVATGRRTDLAAAGLERVGIDTGERAAPVDENLRVTDGVWAVGDVTGHGAFTHVATYQADIAAADILGRAHPPADYHAVPRVTFTDPEVGAVGQTEAQAREAGLSVAVGMADLPSVARGWIHKAGNDGFIKLVADADRGVLVGATSAGPTGGEVLGALTLAVHAEVPLDALRQMIYAYPTFHRGIEDALRDLG